MNMDVFILTEGGKNFGFGHISRCSSVYQAFLKRDILPKFVINGDDSVKSILSNVDFELKNWLNDLSFINSDDIVIIDSYIADSEIYEKIAHKCSLAVYFDDNIRIDYPRGIVVNGLINAEKFNYPNSDNVSYLLGFDFSPLRSDFWYCDKITINDSIKNVLITTGGNDLRNLTPKLLKFLNTNFKEFNKKIIVSDSFENVLEIKSLMDDSCELCYSPNSKEISNIMSGVDLAISSSGQTLYELACLGVPTIAIGIIDNQKDNIKNFQEIDFIEYAGCWNDENLFNNISDKITLLQDKKLREIKKFNGINAIDGKGSLNIVKNILNEYYIENSNLREIHEKDCFRIFEIANDEDVRKNSFSSEKIDLTTHKKWFKNILSDDSVKFFVLEYEDDLIGQIRFDLDEEYPVISISMNRKYRGLGLSKYLLTKGIACLNNSDKIVAYIKKDNNVSISFFKSMGFILEDEVIIKNCEALKFVRS